VPEQVDSRDTRAYLIPVLLLLLVIPGVCVLVESLLGGLSSDFMPLIGKWFVFWSVGVRLFMAGVRQILQPEFTAKKIFELSESGALAVVRELGFANVAMGVLALASAANGALIVPSALVGGLYYGLAGVGHLVRQNRNAIEQIALVSDLLIFALLATFLVSRILS
jgi:uncharacterized membrane protein